MSSPSSPRKHPPVNAGPARRPPITLRRFLHIERGILGYHPRHEEPSPAVPRPPAQAEAILAILAARYQPGDRLSAEQIAEAGGVSRTIASATRVWAKAAGKWSYRPALAGFAALPGRSIRKPRREGGEPWA